MPTDRQLSNIMTDLPSISIGNTELLAKDKDTGAISKVDGNWVAKASDVASNKSKIVDNRFDIDGIAVCHVNELEKIEMHNGEQWQSNTLNVLPSAACNRFDLIQIKAGVKYYYARVWYNFTTIHYNDGSNNYIPNATNYGGDVITNGIAWGSFTAEQDGVIAITIQAERNANGALFTTSEELYSKSHTEYSRPFYSYYVPNKLNLDPAIEGKLNPIVTELERVGNKVDYILTENVNVLNNTTIYNGYLYPHDSVTRTANENANCFELIQIKAGVTYYYRRAWGNFTTIKYNDNTIARLQDGQTGIINGSFVPTKDGVVAITVDKARDGHSALWTTSEEMYNKAVYDSYDVNNLQQNFRIYHCEKSGGDFQSLKLAIEEATKYFDSIVYVGDGVWDIIEELGSEYVESMGVNQRGIYLKNRIHLIFSSKSKVVCNYTGTTTGTRKWLTAFNAGPYGFTLENCTIESSNCRYSVHDERDQDADFYINRYINCKMYHNNTMNPDNIGADQCIGGGLGKNGYVEIVGCYFDGLGEYSSKKASRLVSYHNTSASGATNKVVVKDCYFDKETGIRVNSYGSSTEMSMAYISGCSFGKSPYNGQEAGSTIKNLDMVEWNNVVRVVQ